MEGYTTIGCGDKMADRTAHVEYTTQSTLIPNMSSCETTLSNTLLNQRSELPRTEIRENIGSISHIGVSQGVGSSDALVRLPAGPVQAPSSEAERRTSEANGLSIETSRREPIVEAAQNNLNNYNMTAGQFTVKSVVSAATSATCNAQQINSTWHGGVNFSPLVPNIQREHGLESCTAVSRTVYVQNNETAGVGVEMASSVADPGTPISGSEAQRLPPTLQSSAQVQSASGMLYQLTSSTDAGGTIPDSRHIFNTITHIKKEKCPDSEMTSPPGQFGESPVGDYNEDNEVELSEYQWSNDQSFQLEGNVSHGYEADGDPVGQHNWQGQAMLEVVSYDSGEPVSSADAEGGMSNVNFCINSVRGDVPWRSDDEGDDTMDTGERVLDSHPVRRGRGRGKRGGINYLALPHLRQKNRAGTADGNYSLNSNVRGLIAWLSNAKVPYTLTITQFGYKVLEEPPDANKTIFTCELCNVNCSDVETFYGHCRDKEHVTNKSIAIQNSLRIYTRQKIAKSQAKNKKVNSGESATNAVSTEGGSDLGIAPNVHGQSVHRGGYRGGRRGRGRAYKLSYDGRLQFAQKRKLYQTPNPLLPKRGRGRPRKIQPGPLLVGGVTEGNQPLQTALPFDKTKGIGEEDKRILRVKPLPRQEEGIMHSGDIDSTNCVIEDDPCDSDRTPSLTVPDSVVHRTSPVGISPKRASFDHGETSLGHSLEPRRKRQRYSTETPQESDASSTSASARSLHPSSREPMVSPQNKIHPQNSSPGEVIKRGRGRPRKVRSGSTPGSPIVSSPVSKTSASLRVSPGMTNTEDLPVQIIKVECTPEKTFAPRKDQVEPVPSSTITSSSSFGRKERVEPGPSSTMTSSSSFGRKDRVEPVPSSTITLSTSSGRKERVEPGPSSTVTSSSRLGHDKLLNSLTDNQLWEELLERKTVHACTCGFAFSTSSAYYLHRACHNTVNEKKCSFCGLEAANWMMFHSHFFNHEAPA